MTEFTEHWYKPITTVLREWWALVLVLALLGSIIGGYTGSRSQYHAITTVRVESVASDGSAISMAVREAVLDFSTTEVMVSAANDGSGVSAENLRLRTNVTVPDDAQSISIDVTARIPSQALTEANAIAAAGIAANRLRSKALTVTASQTSRALLEGTRLPDALAERARASRTGDELALRQAALAQAAEKYTIVEAGHLERRTPSTAILILIGLVGGGLLGAAIASFLSPRRGLIRSRAELERTYSGPILDPDEVQVICELEGKRISVILIPVTPANSQAGQILLSELHEQFVRNSRPTPNEAAGQVITRAPSLVIIQATALAALSSRSDALILFPIQLRRTKHTDVSRYLAVPFRQAFVLLNSPDHHHWHLPITS